MKILNKFTLFACLLVILGGCNSHKKLSNKEPALRARGDFNSYLASRYLTYSKVKLEQNNQNKSEYFARKGLDASKGKEVEPEQVNKWFLDDKDTDELLRERFRLLTFKTEENKQHIAEQLATLQFLYDCWIDQASTKLFMSNIGNCRKQYYGLSDEIEVYQNNLRIIEKKKQNPYTDYSNEIQNEFEVYFGFNSYELDAESKIVILKSAETINSMQNDYVVFIEGHADRVGNLDYNLALAHKRALAVKNELTKIGVPRNAIKVTSKGNKDPKVITKKGVKSRNNRRVTIKVEEIILGDLLK